MGDCGCKESGFKTFILGVVIGAVGSKFLPAHATTKCLSSVNSAICDARNPATS